MKNYYKLDLPFKFIRDDLPIPEFRETPDWHWVWQDVANYVTLEGMNFIYSLGISDIRSQVFRGSPNDRTAIHIDARMNDDGSIYNRTCWGLNFSWNSIDCEMTWYESTNDKINSSLGAGENKIRFTSFKETDVSVIEKTIITGLTLIRIDVPHRVVNTDDTNYRYCISLRDYTPENNGDNRWSWEEAVEKFKPWIK